MRISAINVYKLKIIRNVYNAHKDIMQICWAENVLNALLNKIARHVRNKINIIKMDGNGI